MEWLKDKKNRLIVSVLAAMAAAILVAGGGVRYPGTFRTAAGWGTMYPEFCFAEEEGDSPRKIAFRLAEVLDW